MFKFYPIYRRELRSYLSSPAVYVCAGLYFFLSGLFFSGILEQFVGISQSAEMRKELGIDKVNFTLIVVKQLFWIMNFLMLFLVPILTMRLLAEEKKSGTFELLKSLPFSDWNIVVAKFLSAYTVAAGLIVSSLYYVVIMKAYGRPEMPVVWVAFLGAFLSTAAYISIGLLASALTENQIIAAMVAFVLLMGLYLLGDVVSPGSGVYFRFFEILSLRYHTEPFALGMLRLEDCVYFVLMVVVFLFLTARMLELRRWRL